MNNWSLLLTRQQRGLAQYNKAMCSTLQHDSKHPSKAKPKIASSAQHMCTPQHYTTATLRYVILRIPRNPFDELQSYSDIGATLSSDNNSEGDLRPEPLNFDQELFLVL